MSADGTHDGGEVHDVVIVGAGFVGSMLAAQLAAAGVEDVVVLEAGNTVPFDWSEERGATSSFTDLRQPQLDTYYATQLKEDNSPYTQPFIESGGRTVVYAPSPMVDSDRAYFVQPPTGQVFDSIYMRQVGGTSHWLGIAIRLLPSDMEMRTRFGLAMDWPITYDELEPWYGRAERELGVAGDDSTPGLAWRSTPYPMPPIPPSYGDKVVMAAAASERYDGPPLEITRPPVARNSVPYDGRPACMGSNNCTPICPVQAKYDPTVHLKRALGAPDVDGRRVVRPVQLRTGALVTKVVVRPDSPGEVDHLEFLDANRGLEPTVIRARRFVLALHAVENAKLLLMSKVANGSRQVGLNLMDHPCQMTFARTAPVHPFRGPVVTSTIDTFRDGEERRHRASIRMEFQNNGWTWPMGSPTSTVQNAVGEVLRAGGLGRKVMARVADDVSREVAFDSLLDQLPSANNNVTLADERDPIGLPRPKLTWGIDDYTRQGGDFAHDIAKRLMIAMGAEPSSVQQMSTYVGAGHHLGTHRMGSEPATSVTDSYGRTHEHRNLFVLGAGAFPTVGTANPTLTIAALTLRAAEHLVREITGRGGAA